MKKFRFRHIYMVVGSISVILLMILSAPGAGFIKNLGPAAGAFATLIFLVKAVLYVTLLHISRKALHDYVSFGEVARKAMESSEGAGRLAIAVAISGLAAAIVIVGATLGG